MSERYKKALINPKVRFLLRIYLQGFPRGGLWRKKLEEELEYDKSNLTRTITELLDDKLIDSLNPNRVGAPYKITKKGKKFLRPIIYPFQIGLFIAIWVASWSVALCYLFYSQPFVLVSAFTLFIVVSFVAVAVALIFQPYLLLKAGKTYY
jgi:hypothetical protein